MGTQIDWIERIALKQIEDDCSASLSRNNLWLYCNLQTLVIIVLCFHQCGVTD